MPNGKRIHSITIKRSLDTSPDTSHLGEYANKPNSNFSIDRKHTLDCWSQTYNVSVDGIKILNHALDYLNNQPSGPHLEATEVFDILLDTMDECNCDERGDMARNELRYFNPSFNYVESNGLPSEGNTPDEVIAYVKQDYARMESLNAGNWHYIGITAEASIVVTTMINSICQRITSGGLWGIESDSEAGFLKSVEADELADLRSQLKALGFSSRAIAKAFKTIERKED